MEKRQRKWMIFDSKNSAGVNQHNSINFGRVMLTYASKTSHSWSAMRSSFPEVQNGTRQIFTDHLSAFSTEFFPAAWKSPDQVPESHLANWVPGHACTPCAQSLRGKSPSSKALGCPLWPPACPQGSHHDGSQEAEPCCRQGAYTDFRGLWLKLLALLSSRPPSWFQVCLEKMLSV